MACQKRPIERLRHPVISVGFTVKEMRGRERGQELSVLHSRASLFLSSLAITFVPEFPDSRDSPPGYEPGKYINGRRKRYISTWYMNIIAEFSSHFCHPFHRTTMIYRLKILHLNIKRVHLLACNNNSMNCRNPDFLRFAYGVIDTKMENARNIGSSTTMARNNVL